MVPTSPLDKSGFLADGGPTGDALPIDPLEQVLTQWCWAACTAMVVRHRFQGSATTPCQVVDRIFPGHNCCVNGASVLCNVPMDIRATDKPTITTVYQAHGIAHPALEHCALPVVTIKSEIAAKRPVEACLVTGGKSHVVLVVGWEEPKGPGSVTWLLVNDPLGKTTGKLPHSELVVAGNQGSWTDTFLNLA